MSDQSSQSTVYEVRRQSRGSEPKEEASPWKRRLIVGGGVVLVAIVAALAIYLYWSWSHVRLMYARVDGDVLQLSAEANAKVVESLVDPEDEVVVGQVLFRLDDSEARSAVRAAQAEYELRVSLGEQAKAALRQTAAQVKSAIAEAQLNVKAAEARLDEARALLELCRLRTNRELDRARAQHQEALARLEHLKKGAREEEVEAAKARLATARALLGLYELEVQQSQQLAVEGIDSEHILEVKKTQLATQKNRVREAELELQRMVAGPTEEEIRIAEQTVAAREAGLALAKAALKEIDQMTAQVALREAELQHALAALDAAKAREAEVDVAEQKVKAAQAELRIAEADLNGLRERLRHFEVTSPVAGTVLRTFRDPGELCRPGDVVAWVSNDVRGRWVYGYVHERDVHKVSPGQGASVEIIAGSGQQVFGRVAQVSAHTEGIDSGPSAGSPGSRRSDLVWVKLALEDQDLQWRPGLSARALIEVR